MMKRWLGLFACMGLVALSAGAQSGPSVDVGGGYAYRSFSSQSFGSSTPEPRMKMNGWFATFGYNFNGFLGVVTDVDWTRANTPNDQSFPGKNVFSTVMVGPQIYPLGHHRIAPFGHFEVGLAHFSNDISGTSSGVGCGTTSSGTLCTVTDGSFAFDAGGGVDLGLSKHVAVRGGFDWDQSRMFDPGAITLASNQNNWKVKAGIVFHFGGE